jgi:leucyl aminopeptidase (aminopeptidase T)
LQEGEDTMLVSGGGAAKTLGRLLQRLVELKGEEAAREAWAATGEQLAAFLPDGDREDEAAVKALVDKFGLASIGC